jgi:hypothetical protein
MRRTSTKIMNEITAFHAVPKTAEVQVSIRPNAKPPNKAPLRFPIPPRTAAVNALIPRKKPTLKDVF